MIVIDASLKPRLRAAFRVNRESGAHHTDRCLWRALRHLRDYAQGEGKAFRKGEVRCLLGPDWAEHSFSFLLQTRNRSGNWEPWMNGGLIYSGPGQPLDGSGPAFTVGMNDSRKPGWSIHT